MNPVLILSYNGLPLLKQCVESVRMQDIEATVLILDNGSTDGTLDWIDSDDYDSVYESSVDNIGVSGGWNWGLDYIFGGWKSDHCLVLNQDVELPPYFYRQLLACNVPLVTGYPVEHRMELHNWSTKLTPHPCFSAFLIRREVWEKVGPFKEEEYDENGNRKMTGFWSWCNDCDYHVRAHRLGIGMWKANVPFYHFGSSTMKQASERDRWELMENANADRAVFKSLYGVEPGEIPGYSNLFK